MVDDLPDPHVRLIFAVMLYQSGLLPEPGLRREAVAAFGRGGEEIVTALLRSVVAVVG